MTLAVDSGSLTNFVDVVSSLPHAKAILSSALADGRRPGHAYLFCGPGGSGKRRVARVFAAQLLSQGALGSNIGMIQTRVRNGTHPDLTWIKPSGAHEMLRRDVDEAVVNAAARTPFEANFRIFVLEDAEKMNDEAANSLLKTLEEPSESVVIVLITDRLGQVLPTIQSRCQIVRFQAKSEQDLLDDLSNQVKVPTETIRACVRLAGLDGSLARKFLSEEGSELRRLIEGFGQIEQENYSTQPWKDLLALGRQRSSNVKSDLEQMLDEELQFLPRKEHRKRRTEYAERVQRAGRRAETETCQQALSIMGLWYRDLACIMSGTEDLVHNCDRLQELKKGAAGLDLHQVTKVMEAIDATKASLELNVGYELAYEALAYRVQSILGQ